MTAQKKYLWIWLAIVTGIAFVAMSVYRTQNLSKTSIPLAAPSPPAATTDTEEEIILNTAACLVGETKSKASAFGSWRLQINGGDGQLCQVEITNEIEGGYTTYICNVPQSLGNIALHIGQLGVDLSPIQDFCREIVRGTVYL